MCLLFSNLFLLEATKLIICKLIARKTSNIRKKRPNKETTISVDSILSIWLHNIYFNFYI